jgi:hypothetical protein
MTTLDLRAFKPDEWVLLRPLIYVGQDDKHYVAPRGFITDLASIPRLLRALFDINGLSRAPAVLHDFLYCIHYTTRAEADALLLEALEAAGVGWATRWSMYLGVRSGGWMYWNKRGDGINHADFVPDDYLDANQG